MGELSRGLSKVLVLILASTGSIFLGSILGSTLYSSTSRAQGFLCSSLFAEQDNSSRLKIGTYNLLNLYLHTGNINKGKNQPHEKPLWATKQIADLIKSENYDIFVAQEVESISSAKKFNEDFLENKYDVYTTTTKDVRGLFVVFFVKKSLPFHYKLESHAEETWFDPIKNQESPVFERDLPTLHIYRNANDDVPILTMLGVHFKSKRHRSKSRDPQNADEAIDYESNILREAQANRATKIIQQYQIKFGYDHPILMAGDFNSNHNYAPEFAGFLRYTKLSDTVGLKKEITKYSERTTHSYFGSEKPKHNQLDGILVTPSLAAYLKDSYVVRYKNADGTEKDISRTKEERKETPSDHRPITAIFIIEDLRK